VSVRASVNTERALNLKSRHVDVALYLAFYKTQHALQLPLNRGHRILNIFYESAGL
jgi:hypothetical protein